MISIGNYHFFPPIVIGGNNSCFQAAPHGNGPIIPKIRKTDKIQQSLKQSGSLISLLPFSFLCEIILETDVYEKTGQAGYSICKTWTLLFQKGAIPKTRILFRSS